MSVKIIDPLAQSFYVENPNGIFVTSLELFFFSKDFELPVAVQLRPMDLGFPSSKIYSFGEVVLDPDDVSTSVSAPFQPTKVVFDSPVYLKGGEFHAIVILSNSDEYSVYVSRLGEPDIESGGQIIVTKQPLSGSIFKSQNGLTWTPSDYEDLRFNLFRANFTSNGSVDFYNPDLNIGNNLIPTLIKNPLSIDSKKIKVSLNKIISDSEFNIGNTVIQQGTQASAKYVGFAGSAFGSLNVINPGIGYTPSSGSFTYNNVPLISLSGDGKNAIANITVSNGEIVSTGATIVSGGSGYSIGDILSVSSLGNNSLGLDLRLSVSNISGINELILDQVQGDFEVGLGKTLQYVNFSGISTNIGAENIFVQNNGIETENDGTHITVNHKNHGMHSTQNFVRLINIQSDISPSRLATDYNKQSTDDLTLISVSGFDTFENVGISTLNPGYIQIGSEIIAYSGIQGNNLTGIVRNIDQTSSFNYASGTLVQKYEMCGVSLRRINKDHALSDSEIEPSIGLDFYTIKIDMSSGGKNDPLPFGQTNRSIDSPGFPKLFFKETKNSGGVNVKSTENIQFETLRPIVQTLSLPGTNIRTSVNTLSATSIDGNESSFENLGSDQINLNSNNYFTSPRMICSKINEDRKLSLLPGNKSFKMTFDLSTTSNSISPMIDLERVGVILSSNRVNSSIEDFIDDGRVSTLQDDPSAFVYATVPINLETPATALKVYVTAHINVYNDLRCFYSVSNEYNNDLIYSPFPGYSNLTQSGQVIDSSKNDATSDRRMIPEDFVGFLSQDIPFKEYEFTIDNLPQFKYYSIKLIGTSTNQSYPPRLKNLRIIALA